MKLTTATAYRIVREVPLSTIPGTLIELVHEKTGARHFHLATDDDNNGFTVAFVTLPEDSTGVPHILEHSVLDGSERYPVKSFFSMIGRSVNTFMNATTGADRTFYWFTSRHPKDFRNLLEVYLDAVFFPLLEEHTLLQEGRRREFEVGDDPSTPLRFKGVVFNEMKAGSTSAASAIYEGMRRLYAGTTYEHSSGGDPRVIPDLTYEGLKAFYARFYHPTNSVFFTYGNQPLEPLLQAIDELALARFGRGERAVTPLVPRIREPLALEVRFAAGAGDDPCKKAQALLAWLTVDTAGASDLMAMRVLAEYLLQSDASPLRRALLESGLGSALADGTGLGEGAREATFAAGLKDIGPEQAGQVEAIVFDCLRGQAAGIDAALMGDVLNQVELRYRERSNTPMSFALRTVMRVLSPLVRDADPVPQLELDEHFASLRDGMASGLFEKLIAEQLLENPHRALITALADPNLAAEREAEEREKLRQIEAGLDAAARAEILEGAAGLQRRQEAKPDLSVLPNLQPEDLKIAPTDAASKRFDSAGARVELFAQPTGAVSYVRMHADATGLAPAQVERLGTLQMLLPRLGAAGLDHREMAARIAGRTGGVEVGLVSASGLTEVAVGSRALAGDQAEMVAIIRDLLAAPLLDAGRIREVARETYARYQAGAAFFGTSLAPLLAAAGVSRPAAFANRAAGVDYYDRLRGLAAAGDDELAAEALELGRLWRRLFTPERIEVVATAAEGNLPALAGEVTEAVARLPVAAPNGRGAEGIGLGSRAVARTLPQLVSTNAKAFPTVGYEHDDAPALAVLAQFLFAQVLHPEIREKGGAYGGRAGADFDNQVFGLLSYSDPNVTRTHRVFRSLLDRLSGPFPSETVRSAILTASKELDPLLSPDMRGPNTRSNRKRGRSVEVRTAFRDRLLEVSLDELREVAGRYLVEDRAAVATLGNEDAIRTANAELGLFDTVEPLF